MKISAQIIHKMQSTSSRAWDSHVKHQEISPDEASLILDGTPSDLGLLWMQYRRQDAVS